MPHNHIYERLVAGPDDAVGAFAYVLYKQHKVAFVKNVFEARGRDPTDEEMVIFYQQVSLQSQLDGYRQRAQVLAANFLEDGLVEHIVRIGLELQESDFNRRLDRIEGKLDGKRSFWGWCAEVSANLLINIVTIIVIGAAVIGYKSLASFNSATETRFDLGADRTQQKLESSPQPRVP